MQNLFALLGCLSRTPASGLVSIIERVWNRLQRGDLAAVIPMTLHAICSNSPCDSLAMEVAPFGVKVCTLEPGGIRTSWARRAVQNAPDLLPEYEATVGSFLKMLRGLEGRWESDPRKIADVILQLANSDEVPVRLILGVDAEKRVQQAEAARAREAEKWRHLTVSTVFGD